MFGEPNSTFRSPFSWEMWEESAFPHLGLGKPSTMACEIQGIQGKDKCMGVALEEGHSDSTSNGPGELALMRRERG